MSQRYNIGKNQVRMINAFAELKRECGIPHDLVIAGRDGLGHELVYQAARDIQLGDAVRFLGYVPDSDLPALYSAADLVVYPSLFEGFGLPLLEAMACGSIVASADGSCLPEVGGDGVAYFDPRDPTNMATVMLRCLQDDNMRKELRLRGLARAKRFSWEETARGTLNAYRKLYNLRG